jgi:hypothetical protein
MKVAEAIQKDLESFHIPKKFRDEAGTKSFHIFRDKNELGTASDLSTEIANALDNSDFLIVICSNSVKESIWVTREISYFLQNHPRSHVLTVLAEGEPEEIIPEIITREERIMQDGMGNYYTTTVPLEPLSCDYRLPHHKAKRIELPRLTSALLHCSYDDLMNRKRKARVRSITLGFSAALILMASLGVYMFLSKQKIQKNLEASLRNQSIYLANASLELLEDEERILAMQLALAALPQDEEDERPVTPEAIRAITDTTLAYHTNTSGDIHDEWNYEMADYVQDFLISPTGSQLAAIDNSGRVIVWDTATHKVLMNPSTKESFFNEMKFLDDNSLILRQSKGIFSYDPETGNELWHYAMPEGFFRAAEMYVHTGKDGDALFLVTNENKLLKLAGKTGEVIAEYQLPQKEGDDDITISKISFSPSAGKLAFTGYAGYYGEIYLMGIYDLNTGDVKVTPRSSNRYKDISWGSDSRVLVAVPVGDDMSSYSLGSVSYISIDHIKVECLDAESFSAVWEYDFTTTDVMFQSGFYSMLDGEAVAYYSANRSVIFDPSDGTVLHDHTMNSPIVDMEDVNGNGCPFYITSDGCLIGSYKEKDILSVTPTLNTELKSAKISRGIYTQQRMGTQIFFFGVDAWDHNWTPVENGPDFKGTTLKTYLDSSILAVLSKEKAEDVKDTVRGAEDYTGDISILTLIRPLDNKMIDRIIVSSQEATDTEFKLLGCSGGHFYLVTDSAKTGCNLFAIDIATGDIQEKQLAKGHLGNKRADELVGGKYVYLDEDDNFRARVNIYDTITGETVSRYIHDDVTVFTAHKGPVYIQSAGKVFLPGYSEDWLISVEDTSKPGERLDRGENWLQTNAVAYDYNSGRYAITDGHTVIIYNPDLTEAARILCSTSSAIGLSFFGAENKDETSTLLVPCENDFLYRYNGETGEFLGRTKYSFSVKVDSTYFVYSLDRKNLYFYSGSSMSIFETETWVETACIRNCIGYAVIPNRIYTSGYDSHSAINIGYFPLYTVDDLIQKAKDLLQGTEMSDEVKSEYGLDDH